MDGVYDPALAYSFAKALVRSNQHSTLVDGH